jgi:hypothetical protein
MLYNSVYRKWQEGMGLHTRAGAALLALLLALTGMPAYLDAAVDTDVIAPAYAVPDYVLKLLDVARGELGYMELASGYTKYGEWSGDPFCEWCAEFLCWCVSTTDSLYGTGLLNAVYPLYSGTNTGLNWFLKQGRYIARKGFVNGWGTQWYINDRKPIERDSYIPQPGDWMFFSSAANKDTTHVAMVEFCSRDQDGNVAVHVLEGNMPDKVQRSAYPLNEWSILGYGTVYDLADIVLRAGNEGEKVRALQKNLASAGLVDASVADGLYGSATVEAVKQFQKIMDSVQTGIANRQTQIALREYVNERILNDPSYWIVDVP